MRAMQGGAKSTISAKAKEELPMISHGLSGLCEARPTLVRRKQSPAKITHKTGQAEKSPTRQSKKSPTRRSKKSPSYYNQRGVSLVGIEEMRKMLRKSGQGEWDTTVRIEGLQLLLWNCLRRDNKKGFCISTSLAEQYVSEIKRPKSGKTIRTPLGLLCQVGLVVRTHPSISSWHLKQVCSLQDPSRLREAAPLFHTERTPAAQTLFSRAPPRIPLEPPLSNTARNSGRPGQAEFCE